MSRWMVGEDLREPLTLPGLRHAPARCGSDWPAAIVTGPRQWSYALSFRVPGSWRDAVREAGGLIVRVSFRVESGRFGIGLLDDGGTRFLVERELEPEPEAGGPVTVTLAVAECPATLVIRNTAGGGTPSSGSLYAVTAAWARPPDFEAEFLADPFGRLRAKWQVIPAGAAERVDAARLLDLDDAALRDFWLGIRAGSDDPSGFEDRGWYLHLYRNAFRGRRILDVGSGLGIDTITFAEAGAQVTCLDVVETNLRLVGRVAGILGVALEDVIYLKSLGSLERLRGAYDVIWCNGSMINAPFDLMREESRLLLEHLPLGGRWIELAYPRERWEDEGALPFHQWGERTDGPGTPWAEWYDLDKLLARLAPARFDVVLNVTRCHGAFIWLDLLRRA